MTKASHLLAALCVLGPLTACSGGGGNTPTSPSTPTPTPTRIISISGTLAYGSVGVGQTSDRTVTIANSGNESLVVTGMTGPEGYTASWTSGTIVAGGSQAVTVRFAPTAATTYNGTVTVNGNHTSGTNTITVTGSGMQTGPRTSFGNGQYLVNTDIVAARYYSDPLAGCYWERQRGLSGSLSDIIANNFIGSNHGQTIIDISGSDRAFETEDCGTWFQTPRTGLQLTITTGTWLVETQIRTGVYRVSAPSGCYWELLRNFSGELSAIIDNEFVSSAGQQIVEIESGDTGFQSDDCGTWDRIGDAGVPATANGGPSSADIERSWRAWRNQRGTGRR